MKFSPFPQLLLASLLLLLAPSCYAGTYYANSCSLADVNDCINGSGVNTCHAGSSGGSKATHTAVNGDVINIPSGTCTWTTDLAVNVSITIQGAGTPNTTPSTFGAGTLNTIIVDDYASGPIIQAEVSYSSGALLRISTLDIEPESASTSLSSPISVAGTCTSSGCPNLRIDNIAFGPTTPWTESENGSNADTMIRTDNVFGVLDHDTLPTGSGVSFANVGHSAYLGVGSWGDNSWAQADTFGGANSLYAENNSFYTTEWLIDDEFSPTGGGEGGGRYVARFNEVTCYGCIGVWSGHGLDTSGRPRSIRQIEAYGNTISCQPSSTECGGITTGRGGTFITFGNTMTVASSSGWSTVSGPNIYRNVFNPSSWSYCGGLNSLNPWDTNDNTVYYSGTITVSGSGVLTMTDSSKSFPGLAVSGAPYSVYDTTQGFISEVASNTATTITIQPPISESTWTGLNNGDSYEIIRSTVCGDQFGRGAGNYISGTTPSPSSALSEALDPAYEWDDTAPNFLHGNITPGYTIRVIANRDYFTDNSNGSPRAQTSATSPFNGSSGVGFGTLANRPTTCTAGVGYYATDQGTWNQSGNSFGQGELFVCSATNTWTLHYTPYTYPNPLETASNQGATAPPTLGAPTGLTDTVQPR